jgi:hypothetical protein
VARGKTPHGKSNQENSPVKKGVMFSPQPQKPMTLEQFEEKLNHDHLKSAITALNEKLKFYENIESERAILKD